MYLQINLWTKMILEDNSEKSIPIKLKVHI